MTRPLPSRRTRRQSRRVANLDGTAYGFKDKNIKEFYEND